MAHPDNPLRQRSKNIVSQSKRLLTYGIAVLALYACSTIPPSQTSSPPIEPTSISQASPLPLVSPEFPTVEIPTPYPPTIEIPTAYEFSLKTWPSTWPAEADFGQYAAQYEDNNTQQVMNEMSDSANQIEKARSILGDGPVDATLNLIFTKPDGTYYGGTGSVVADGDVLTVSHLQPEEFTSLTVIQPSTGLQWTVTPEEYKVSKPIPRFEDVALIRIPEISGILPVPISTMNYCTSTPPPVGTQFITYAFPFFPSDNPNRINDSGYTPYTTIGLVTEIDNSTCITLGPEEFIPLSTPLINGMSGGPDFIWDATLGKYALAGINTRLGPGSMTTDGTRGLAAPVSQGLIDLLQTSIQ